MQPEILDGRFVGPSRGRLGKRPAARYTQAKAEHKNLGNHSRATLPPATSVFEKRNMMVGEKGRSAGVRGQRLGLHVRLVPIPILIGLLHWALTILTESTYNATVVISTSLCTCFLLY